MSRRSQLLALLLFAVACVLLWLRRRHEHVRRFLTRKLTSGGAPTQPSFYAFLSHYKMEAASDARLLHDMLAKMLRYPIFLDSAKLTDLRALITDGVAD